jgi:hypothetical protein
MSITSEHISTSQVLGSGTYYYGSCSFSELNTEETLKEVDPFHRLTTNLDDFLNAAGFGQLGPEVMVPEEAGALEDLTTSLGAVEVNDDD